ncbi:MAG: hypothetical protein HKN91_12900 [Acidimicrobiia bacterium]|nr:hypothetical protein [Acidimicrobiia bacterium]
MNRAILELIDTVELAVTRSTGNAPQEEIVEAQARVDGLRGRKGHFGEILVVALAGGTGSGKSSFLNAVAGEDVAGVSILRPHTQTPLAWIPRERSEGVERLLDDLGISQRVLQDDLPHIALLDMPDIDSIADWHRQMVEDLLPHVDAVLWIMDPEKYHDEVIHEHFLSPLSAFEDQFLFVLNKIDQLPAADVDVVRSDLIAALRHDGFKRPVLFPLAANPDSGPTVGIDRVVTHLAEEVDIKRVAIGKAINDVAAILHQLGESAAALTGGGVDFEARWAKARDASAQELVTSPGPAAREDAIRRLEDLVAALATEVGTTLGSELRERFPSQRIERAVDTKLATAGTSADDLGARLEAALGEPLRRLIWRRALFAATLASGVVATYQLRHRYSPER